MRPGGSLTPAPTPAVPPLRPWTCTFPLGVEGGEEADGAAALPAPEGTFPRCTPAPSACLLSPVPTGPLLMEEA